MSKTLITLFFVFSTLLGATIVGLSMGWFFMVFAIVLIPATILHVVAGLRAVKAHPRLNYWLILSGILFVAFCLIRPDGNYKVIFTGYSTVLFLLGVYKEPFLSSWSFLLEVSLLLIFSLIAVDAVMLRKAKS